MTQNQQSVMKNYQQRIRTTHICIYLHLHLFTYFEFKRTFVTQKKERRNAIKETHVTVFKCRTMCKEIQWWKIKPPNRCAVMCDFTSAHFTNTHTNSPAMCSRIYLLYVCVRMYVCT